MEGREGDRKLRKHPDRQQNINAGCISSYPLLSLHTISGWRKIANPYQSTVPANFFKQSLKNFMPPATISKLKSSYFMNCQFIDE